jgi:hypothetical protein
VPVSSESRRNPLVGGTSVLEKTVGVNVITSTHFTGSSEGVDGVGKSVDGISVVERLGTKDSEKSGVAKKGRTVIHILVGLDNPDKLLHGVVEVELDLVGGRTDRLVTSELELGDEVLVGVLGEAAALVSVKEDIVNIERGSDKRLVVGDGGAHSGTRVQLSARGCSASAVAAQRGDSPQALINRTKIEVDLDLVVLEGNQRKGKTGVGAKPELKRNIKSGLRKSIAGSANLARSQGVARAINIREGRISDEGKLGGVTNHLEVAALLLRGHCELVPDVHPVTILAVNALATNLNLNLGDELLTRVV